MSGDTRPSSSDARQPFRSWTPGWETALAYVLIEAALWTEGDLRWFWSWLASAWIIGITLYRRPSLRELGLGAAGLRRSLWIVPVALLVAVAIVLAGVFAGTAHSLSLRRGLLLGGVAYLFWALQQQFVLQSFMFLRLEKLLGGAGRAVVVSALLFAAAHIPNPVLMAATLVVGLVFCELFRRYRNLYPLALAHGLLGLALALAIPDAIHRHMRVGIGYLRFHL